MDVESIIGNVEIIKVVNNHIDIPMNVDISFYHITYYINLKKVIIDDDMAQKRNLKIMNYINVILMLIKVIHHL